MGKSESGKDIAPRLRLLDPFNPELPLNQKSLEIPPIVMRGIGGEIASRQLQQGDRWTETSLLEMDERPRILDEPFVKPVLRRSAGRQPQLFQNVMRLVELPGIEAMKVGQGVCVELLAQERGDSLGDFGRFM